MIFKKTTLTYLLTKPILEDENHLKGVSLVTSQIFYLDVLHLEHVHFIMASFENFAFARLHLFPKEINPKLYFEL